jgi:signal transduction histidine kinase
MRFIAGGESLGRSLQVSLRLSDGSWLNFATPFTGSVPFWSLRFVLSLAVMAVAVIALSVWVVRRLTAPLAIFARAAERLGVDVNAPPLLESGPREVRQATRAFNEMQRRIRRFIDDRTQMVAAISHDLRTPLTRLRLRAEFVEDAEHHDKMLHDIDEMETMIASVLSFARDAAADEPHELIDVVALLQSVCDDAADAGGQVALEAAGQTTISGRSMALRRAMTNLIDNAVKYGERARVALEATDEWITIRVDDDGPGIPDGKAERVFEPFYRLETSRSRETGGVGLGLSVARTIIRAHGGDIELANRPEGGLRVSVSLPGQRAA